MLLKKDMSPEKEIRSLIKTALEKGYEIEEIQATMGDMLELTSGESAIYFRGYKFRIGKQIAIITK